MARIAACTASRSCSAWLRPSNAPGVPVYDRLRSAWNDPAPMVITTAPLLIRDSHRQTPESNPPVVVALMLLSQPPSARAVPTTVAPSLAALNRRNVVSVHDADVAASPFRSSAGGSTHCTVLPAWMVAGTGIAALLSAHDSPHHPPTNPPSRGAAVVARRRGDLSGGSAVSCAAS